jgi:hypothetical protein
LPSFPTVIDEGAPGAESPTVVISPCAVRAPMPNDGPDPDASVHARIPEAGS